MIIPPLNIEQDGPGIDLSDQPDGIAVEMSDPVTDFEYARNAVRGMENSELRIVN